MSKTKIKIRTFDFVDSKIVEADFFLEKIKEVSKNPITSRYYFSAFVSASRSVTFALQAVMKDIEGFTNWYEGKKYEMQKDDTLRFFVEVRNICQKIGYIPINSIKTKEFMVNPLPFFKDKFCSQENNDYKLYFDFGFDDDPINVPTEDVYSASHYYLTTLCQLIWECYEEFGKYIDPEDYYTLENMQDIGVSIEDWEEELGFPRGWTEGIPIEERVKALKNTVAKTQIDYLFLKYLNKSRCNQMY